jgi:hypothetical protein
VRYALFGYISVLEAIMPFHSKNVTLELREGSLRVADFAHQEVLCMWQKPSSSNVDGSGYGKWKA